MTFTPETMIDRVFALMLEPFAVHNGSLDRVVDMLADEAAFAEVPEVGHAPGVCIVFADLGYNPPPRVTLCYAEPVSLGVVLEEIAAQTGLHLSHHPTGVLLLRHVGERPPEQPPWPSGRFGIN